MNRLNEIITNSYRQGGLIKRDYCRNIYIGGNVFMASEPASERTGVRPVAGVKIRLFRININKLPSRTSAGPAREAFAK